MLPTHVLGHIGYHVVAWKRRKGYAAQALNEILPHAKDQGLRFVELTTEIDNVGSRKTTVAAQVCATGSISFRDLGPGKS